jgi:hypothetical protein
VYVAGEREQVGISIYKHGIKAGLKSVPARNPCRRLMGLERLERVRLDRRRCLWRNHCTMSVARAIFGPSSRSRRDPDKYGGALQKFFTGPCPVAFLASPIS